MGIRNQKAIVGLTLGLVSLLLGMLGLFFPISAVFSLPVAIAGLICSVIGRKEVASIGGVTAVGNAGYVIGIIAVVFGAMSFLTCGLCVLFVPEPGMDV